MEMGNIFPAHRRNDRKRQAELAVYQAYADSPTDGLALYSTVPPGGSEIDIIAWHVGHVRMAVGIKGGPYEQVNSVWQRITDQGAEPLSAQASHAFDAGMKLYRYPEEARGRPLALRGHCPSAARHAAGPRHRAGMRPVHRGLRPR